MAATSPRCRSSSRPLEHNPFQSPETQFTDTAPGDIRPSSLDLAGIAQGQRWIRLVFFANILAVVLLATTIERVQGLANGLLGASMLGGLVGAVTVAQALYRRRSAAFVYALLMIVPLVNLAVLLYLNAKATAAIRSAGVRVGLFGAYAGDLHAATQTTE